MNVFFVVIVNLDRPERNQTPFYFILGINCAINITIEILSSWYSTKEQEHNKPDKEIPYFLFITKTFH